MRGGAVAKIVLIATGLVVLPLIALYGAVELALWWQSRSFWRRYAAVADRDRANRPRPPL